VIVLKVGLELRSLQFTAEHVKCEDFSSDTRAENRTTNAAAMHVCLHTYACLHIFKLMQIPARQTSEHILMMMQSIAAQFAGEMM
jgi:hypothetical protein